MRMISILENLTRRLLPSFLCIALAGIATGSEITDQTVAILYEVKADIPTPRERIAESMSADYRQQRDEFSRHEFLEKLNPVIDRRIKEAAETKDFTVTVGTQLEDYDFTRKAFPTGTAPDSFIPFRGDYVVRFTNPQEVSHISVPLEEAKKAATALKSSRTVAITYTGTLDKSVEETINYATRKVVYLKIHKITLVLANGGQQFTQDIGPGAP